MPSHCSSILIVMLLNFVWFYHLIRNHHLLNWHHSSHIHCRGSATNCQLMRFDNRCLPPWAPHQWPRSRRGPDTTWSRRCRLVPSRRSACTRLPCPRMAARQRRCSRCPWPRGWGWSWRGGCRRCSRRSRGWRRPWPGTGKEKRESILLFTRATTSAC